MKMTISIMKTALIMALCSAGGAYAETATAPAESALAARLGVPMDSSQLGEQRGGFEQLNNDQQLSGTVARNSATNFSTGSNYIANGSFVGASGFPTVIQNSGANVLIQNATIINLHYQ